MTMGWKTLYLELARTASRKSKDPSKKVGTVIVRPDKTVAGIGFNGFPRGVKDDPTLYSDKEAKLQRIVHAEANAILNVRGPVEGCDLYVTPLFPCTSCAGLIIQAGIRQVFYEMPDAPRDYWAKQFEVSGEMFLQAGIPVTQL